MVYMPRERPNLALPERVEDELDILEERLRSEKRVHPVARAKPPGMTVAGWKE
jgi:hypothetical protein